MGSLKLPAVISKGVKFPPHLLQLIRPVTSPKLLERVFHSTHTSLTVKHCRNTDHRAIAAVGIAEESTVCNSVGRIESRNRFAVAYRFRIYAGRQTAAAVTSRRQNVNAIVRAFLGEGRQICAAKQFVVSAHSCLIADQLSQCVILPLFNWEKSVFNGNNRFDPNTEIAEPPSSPQETNRRAAPRVAIAVDDR